MSEATPDSRGRATSYALVMGAAVSWGTWSLMLRPAARLGPLAPELVPVVIQTVMSLVLVPLGLRERPGAPRSPRAWALLAALALSSALNNWLFFRAMSLTTLAVAVLTHSLAPVLVTALAPWLFGERASRRTWVCLLGALAGLTLLLEPWQSPARGLVAGAAAGAGSAVFYAFNMIAQKRLAGAFGPCEAVGYQTAMGVPLLALLVPSGGWSLTAGQAALVGLAGLGPGAAASLAFIVGLRRLPASHTATLVLLEPLVAVLLGVLVWHEPLTPVGALGGLVLFGAIAASVRAR